MINSPHTIRNYRPDDFNDYARLHSEAEKLDQAGRYISSPLLSEYLSRPNHAPEQDLFIAEVSGKLVGCMDVTPELGIRRVVLDCVVHPDYRRRGLATALSPYALGRAARLGAQVAHVSVAQDNGAARSLLHKLGFSFIRRHVELRLQISKARLTDSRRVATLCRHLEYGEEDKLTHIQNQCFAGTWGFNPNNVAEIMYRLNMSNCSPKDVIFVSQEGKDVGYCWTTVVMREEAIPGSGKGRIQMLGVAPEYRGRGLGKLLVLAGLSYLNGRGVEVVELTVDSENRAALAIYESLGFKTSSTTFWYEKKLD